MCFCCNLFIFLVKTGDLTFWLPLIHCSDLNVHFSIVYYLYNWQYKSDISRCTHFCTCASSHMHRHTVNLLKYESWIISFEFAWHILKLSVNYSKMFHAYLIMCFTYLFIYLKIAQKFYHNKQYHFVTKFYLYWFC